MINYAFFTIIVPAELVEQCRGLAIALAGQPAAGMWTAGLSTDGAAPATHFISSGAIEEKFAAVLGSAEVMYVAASSLGVSISLEACEAILSACTVVALDDEPVDGTLQRLKLQLQISDPIP